MQEIIKVGDIVISKSHKTRGKVMKINHYDYSVLLEVIVKKDVKAGTRTTKLLTFHQNDLRLYKFKSKNNDESKGKEENAVTNSELTDFQGDMFDNTPNIKFSAETLKKIESAMKLNKLDNVPAIQLPKLNGQYI